MAVEPVRGCGFRKVGGLYLVAGQLAEPCHRLPLLLTTCPTCGHGVKPARGWTWVDAPDVLAPGCQRTTLGREHCARCIVCTPALLDADQHRAGLLWIGEQHYATPAAFELEASRLGVSRRIGALPRGFLLGRTWVLLGHRKACPSTTEQGGELLPVLYGAPGIFHAFQPQRVELLVYERDATPEARADAERRGITLVVVPNDDPDHAPRGKP